MFKITLPDWLALGWFVLCWAGYTWFADHRGGGEQGLMKASNLYRLEWARGLLAREVRIMDSALIGNLIQSVSFFANTTIFIIAGLLTLLGGAEHGVEVTGDLPFARQTSRELWELKLLLLLAIFVYAFFKFTWALRQFNFFSILMGAAPQPGSQSQADEGFVCKIARINAYAGDDFNRGVRAYYFGLAALAWFIQPWVFMAVTTVVLWVLYRRDFASPTLHALEEGGLPPGPGK